MIALRKKENRGFPLFRFENQMKRETAAEIF